MMNYEKKQWTEQRETNLILWINTVATIIIGISTIIIALK